jgi:cytoskeletal protein CcmA (bactofilin family)
MSSTPNRSRKSCSNSFLQPASLARRLIPQRELQTDRAITAQALPVHGGYFTPCGNLAADDVAVQRARRWDRVCQRATETLVDPMSFHNEADGVKMPTDTSQQSARAQNSGTPRISTIGDDLTIIGNVTSKGELHLDGQVQGDVHCVALVLGENSNVEGNVTADDVVIRGRLIGSVRALRVTLQSESHVEGDLFHKSLAVEQGAHFEGKSRPSEERLSPRQEAPSEGATAKIQPAPERSEQRRDEPARGFIRSLPESRSA